MIIDTEKLDIDFLKRLNQKNQLKAFLHSFGCAQNVADGEKINGILVKCGYEITDKIDEANLIIFNTCAVRKAAEEKVYGHIGALKKYKKQNKELIIVVCGCMSQRPEVQSYLKEHFPYVNVVFGTGSMQFLPTFLMEYITKHKNVYHSSIENSFECKEKQVRTDNIKATVTIMQGCNNFCSYCIVPYVRGREISRPFDEIICEVKELVKNGYKDITLLGQNVNSYNFEGHKFTELLRSVDDIPGEYWLRFMTSHPKDCSFELLDVVKNGKHICHHIHLPVQSGSDKVLKNMNRHYDIKRYVELIDYAQRNIPELSISTDIIVGYPGETYEDFLMTYELCKNVRYSALFNFIFSPREGTKACELDDPISYEVKNKWLTELIKLQEEVSFGINQSFVGKTMKVLIDNDGKGRTQGNTIVNVKNCENYIGKFVNVKINIARRTALEGEIL